MTVDLAATTTYNVQIHRGTRASLFRRNGIDILTTVLEEDEEDEEYDDDSDDDGEFDDYDCDDKSQPRMFTTTTSTTTTPPAPDIPIAITIPTPTQQMPLPPPSRTTITTTTTTPVEELGACIDTDVQEMMMSTLHNGISVLGGGTKGAMMGIKDAVLAVTAVDVDCQQCGGDIDDDHIIAIDTTTAGMLTNEESPDKQQQQQQQQVAIATADADSKSEAMMTALNKTIAVLGRGCGKGVMLGTIKDTVMAAVECGGQRCTDNDHVKDVFVIDTTEMFDSERCNEKEWIKNTNCLSEDEADPGLLNVINLCTTTNEDYQCLDSYNGDDGENNIIAIDTDIMQELQQLRDDAAREEMNGEEEENANYTNFFLPDEEQRRLALFHQCTNDKERLVLLNLLKRTHLLKRNNVTVLSRDDDGIVDGTTTASSIIEEKEELYECTIRVSIPGVNSTKLTIAEQSFIEERLLQSFSKAIASQSGSYCTMVSSYFIVSLGDDASADEDRDDDGNNDIDDNNIDCIAMDQCGCGAATGSNVDNNGDCMAMNQCGGDGAAPAAIRSYPRYYEQNRGSEVAAAADAQKWKEVVSDLLFGAVDPNKDLLSDDVAIKLDVFSEGCVDPIGFLKNTPLRLKHCFRLVKYEHSNNTSTNHEDVVVVDANHGPSEQVMEMWQDEFRKTLAAAGNKNVDHCTVQVERTMLVEQPRDDDRDSGEVVCDGTGSVGCFCPTVESDQEQGPGITIMNQWKEELVRTLVSPQKDALPWVPCTEAH